MQFCYLIRQNNKKDQVDIDIVLSSQWKACEFSRSFVEPEGEWAVQREHLKESLKRHTLKTRMFTCTILVSRNWQFYVWRII
eukprot:UN30521